MKESDIAYENGSHWVFSDMKKKAYVVFVAQPTHYSISDSAYALDADGLSIAKARCDYLERRRIGRESCPPQN